MQSFQKGTRVAFQGERGAYSEEAAFLFFGPLIQVVPYKGLPEVFQAVEKGIVDFGVVPVENSLEGSVNETYDLLLGSELRVGGEINLRVVHCLIASPRTRLNDVETVYSHPQALAQCRQFLEDLACELVPTYDTAGSVKMIKDRKLAGAGAVAGRRAAEIYRMQVISRGIEDNQNNYTRFFVLSEEDSQPSGEDKTSIIFSVKHVPSALFSALEEFAVRNINLTKIESRPTRQKAWEYNFYLDFEGHRSERRCQEALRGLEKKSIFLKVLGSYPKAK